jgi:protein-S-isoprenylcysteine O-methyltransferase Ste14
VIAVVIAYSFFDAAYQYLKPFLLLGQEWIRVTGVVLLLLSLAWTILAQSQMGDSWRIGIDNEHPTNLVRRGVFGLSRNPIFVGIMVTLLGLFLAIPNVVTLLTLLLGVVLINVQVRLEEEFLRKLHGADYEDYLQRVRRWI